MKLPDKSVWIDPATGKLNINIWPKQKQFIDANDIDEILMGGAVGGGKSHAILLFCLRRRLDHPGSRGIVFRRHYPDLERTLIPKSHEFFLKVGAKYNQSKHIWNFKNGSVQEFGFAETDADVYKFHSAEYADMCFDELTTFCVHPDTDVLTQNGWKNITQVETTDSIATVSKCKKITYAPPTRLWEFPYDGKLLELYQRKGMSFSVTPNHRMVVVDGDSWNFEEARNMKNFSFHLRVGDDKWGLKKDFIFKLPETRGHGNSVIKVKSEDWMEFLGWYLSEGCAFETIKNDGAWSGPHVNICQSLSANPKKCEQIKNLLKRLGWRWSFYPKNRTFKIFSRQLYETVKSWGNSHTKRIPRYVFKYSKKHLEILLEAFIDGDGHREKYGGVQFGLASEGLVDDLQELCTLIGRISTKGFSTSNRNTPVWRLNISNPKRKSTEVRKKDIKEVAYKGSVWCLTVKPNHNFIARHRGRVFITGNTEFQFKYLTTRARSSIPGVRPLIRCTSNPGNIGHIWVRQRYIEPAKVQLKWWNETEKKTMAFIPARLEDNPSLRKNDPTYEDRLRILGDKKFKALRYGDWDVFEGQFFNEWSKDHVLPYNRVPDSYSRKFLCMDWGYASPACVLWLEVTASGRIFIYRELYVTRMAPKELAEAICNCSPKEERYQSLWAPPEIWGKEVELEAGGQPIQRLMQTVFNRLRSDIVMQKANNARVPGWTKMREYLRRAPDGLPWLQVSPCCENLIRTLPMMIHDEHKVEDLDTDAEDHASDCARYGIVGLNMIPRTSLSPYGVQTMDKVFGSAEEFESVSRIPISGHSGYGI